MRKKFKLLRRTMFEDDVDQMTLGKTIGRSSSYISARFSGKMPFDANDMYAILDFLGVPHDQIHKYFPPNGLEEKTEAEKT